MAFNLSSIFGNQNPNQLNQQQIQDTLGKYGFINKQTYDQYKVLPEFAKAQVNPVGNGYAAIDKSVLDSLNNYKAIDTSKLGEDAFSKAMLNRAYKVGDKSYLTNTDFDYYSKFGSDLSKSKLPYYGLNAVADPYKDVQYMSSFQNYPGMNLKVDGQDMIYMPYEAGARVGYDAKKDQLQYLTDVLGNEDFFKYGKAVDFSGSTLDQIKQSLAKSGKTNWISSDYDYYDNPGLGYLFSPADYDKYVFNKNTKNRGDAALSQAGGVLDTGHGTHDESALQGAWLFRNTPSMDLSKVPSIGGNLENSSWVAQSAKDPELFARLDNKDKSWHQSAYDQYTKQKGLVQITNKFNPVVSALVDPVLGGFVNPVGQFTDGTLKDMEKYNLREVGETTNRYGPMIASMWAGGAGAGSAASSVGSAAASTVGATGLSAAANTAIGNAIIQTGLGLAKGDSLGNAAKNGIIGGITGYAGSNLAGLFSRAGTSQILSRALTGAGTNALRSVLSGNSRNLGTNTLAGLFGGALSGAGQSSGLNAGSSNALAKLATQYALMQRQRRG